MLLEELLDLTEESAIYQQINDIIADQLAKSSKMLAAKLSDYAAQHVHRKPLSAQEADIIDKILRNPAKVTAQLIAHAVNTRDLHTLVKLAS